jgi:hypothetical protein
MEREGKLANGLIVGHAYSITKIIEVSPNKIDSNFLELQKALSMVNRSQPLTSKSKTNKNEKPLGSRSAYPNRYASNQGYDSYGGYNYDNSDNYGGWDDDNNDYYGGGDDNFNNYNDYDYDGFNNGKKFDYDDSWGGGGGNDVKPSNTAICLLRLRNPWGLKI